MHIWMVQRDEEKAATSDLIKKLKWEMEEEGEEEEEVEIKNAE